MMKQPDSLNVPMREQRVQWAIDEILSNDPKMKVFSMHSQGMVDKDFLRLCEAFKQNDYIEELELSGNRIGDEGVIALVATLPNIKKLNLRENHIKVGGAKAVASLEHLNELNIGDNAIGDEGALALSRCKSKNLESLDLRNTKITDEGMKHLVKHSECLLIYIEDNYQASRNYWARVDAAWTYNRMVRDEKLLPNKESVITETREEYAEKHWKKHYMDPAIQWSIYDYSAPPELLKDMEIGRQQEIIFPNDSLKL